MAVTSRNPSLLLRIEQSWINIYSGKPREIRIASWLPDHLDQNLFAYITALYKKVVLNSNFLNSLLLILYLLRVPYRFRNAKHDGFRMFPLSLLPVPPEPPPIRLIETNSQIIIEAISKMN